MAYESPSHNKAPDLREGGELRYYPNEGRVDVVYKRPGSRFNMADLTDHFSRDPVVQDIGSVLVQVMGHDGRPQNFYMDMNHAVSKDQPWLVANLDKFLVTDPSHDIVVGQPWQSPFGTTGAIYAVVMPYNHGVNLDSCAEAGAGAISHTGIGRQLIDGALEQ
jgi:hypothetical protein